MFGPYYVYGVLTQPQWTFYENPESAKQRFQDEVELLHNHPKVGQDSRLPEWGKCVTLGTVRVLESFPVQLQEVDVDPGERSLEMEDELWAWLTEMSRLLGLGEDLSTSQAELRRQVTAKIQELESLVALPRLDTLTREPTPTPEPTKPAPLQVGDWESWEAWARSFGFSGTAQEMRAQMTTGLYDGKEGAHELKSWADEALDLLRWPAKSNDSPAALRKLLRAKVQYLEARQAESVRAPGRPTERSVMALRGAASLLEINGDDDMQIIQELVALALAGKKGRT